MALINEASYDGPTTLGLVEGEALLVPNIVHGKFDEPGQHVSANFAEADKEPF